MIPDICYPDVSLRRVLSRIEQGWSPSADDRPADAGEWAVLKLSAVKGGRFWPDEQKALGDTPPRREFEVLPGDLLLTRANTPDLVGDVCVVGDTPRRLMLSDLLYRLTLDARRAEARYVAYWLLSAPGRATVSSDARGSSQSMVKINQGHIRAWTLSLPPLPTQKAIADFLDRKTAAIDALIEKKQRLLDLLAEKRAALINQAVTKGLDPNVPMKDSGIPWIGEIPAHWEVKRLKHVSNFVTSGPRGWGQYYSDSGPLFLRITNVARDGIDLLLDDDKQQCISPPPGAEGVRTLAVEGDVLVTITADLGSVGVVPGGLGEAYISQHVALCRPAGGMMARLVAYMVRGPWGRVHYDQAMNGGTKVGLTLDDVRNTPLAVPPADQQAELVSRLDGYLGQFDGTATRLGDQIDRLQEYRQALITAAVTGQLDITREATA